MTEPTASVMPKPSAAPGSIRPAGIGPVPGPAHHRVDIAVVPHVDRAARPGRDRDAQHGGERQHRIQMARRDQQADQAGEHHQAS